MSLSTRTIFLKMKDSPMGTFLANWVMFEELLVTIYQLGRSRRMILTCSEACATLSNTIIASGPTSSSPYWTQVKLAGRALSNDPFLAALDTR